MTDNNNLQDPELNNLNDNSENDNSENNFSGNSGEYNTPDDYQNQQADADEMSPFDRFAKVITSPQEAFVSLLHSTKKTAIILWGIVFCIIAYSFSTIVVTSSDGVKQAIKDKQTEQFEKMKEDGKMTDDDIEKAQSMMDSDGMIIMFSIFGIVFGTPLIWALCAVVYYLVARSLEKERNEGLVYSTAFAALMITSVISMIASVVNAVGSLITNGEFSFSLNQIIKTDNIILKFLLGLTDPFTLWWIFVAAIGLSVISRVSKSKAMAVCFGAYIIVGLCLSAMAQFFKGIFASFGA